MSRRLIIDFSSSASLPCLLLIEWTPLCVRFSWPSLALPLCTHDAAAQTVTPASGIPLDVATRRAAIVSDLRYELSLAIPEAPLSDDRHDDRAVRLRTPRRRWSSTSRPAAST